VSLTRTVIVLLGALAVMIAVVALRAETTRIQFETSQHDRRAEELLVRLRAQELELARLRNPAIIRDRVTELRLGTIGLPAAGDARAASGGAPKE
jgi:hypothetical protein